MAVVYGELYSVLRSLDVSHELAQEAARVDNFSPKNTTCAGSSLHLRCFQVSLALNIALLLILLVVR
ncbi:hypothetical protein [Mesorhizobium sp. ZC-5]|uniref:hypothetical protein n=1 Tax=Mesorhizobium sp. ZC-5 TaxID=2986066 RepID=UPI0021E8013D|nr:hypothetical protein [Mesorhizobium sp. ZC-5]MCV3243707.1 hypothetical protein [Mesorhizobium sp. ZC-5]